MQSIRISRTYTLLFKAGGWLRKVQNAKRIWMFMISEDQDGLSISNLVEISTTSVINFQTDKDLSSVD